MATIQINQLHRAGSELLEDEESFLQDLDIEHQSNIIGADTVVIIPLHSNPITFSNSGVINTIYSLVRK